jgi:hypothetical protein
MRIAVIAMLLLTILLVAGAGFRLATARASTPALFGINIAPKDPPSHGHTHRTAKKTAPAATEAPAAADAASESADDAASESADNAAAATSSGDEKQSALVGHLKGNSWEKSEAPASGEVSEDKQLEDAAAATDGRQEDLKDAKARIGQIGK